jgi:hypothetical protein
VETRYYGDHWGASDDLAITGPAAIKEILIKSQMETLYNSRCYLDWEEARFDEDGKWHARIVFYSTDGQKKELVRSDPEDKGTHEKMKNCP